jgi:hypothetical protein
MRLVDAVANPPPGTGRLDRSPLLERRRPVRDMDNVCQNIVISAGMAVRMTEEFVQ